jgi:hypothetical protein
MAIATAIPFVVVRSFVVMAMAFVFMARSFSWWVEAVVAA